MHCGIMQSSFRSVRLVLEVTLSACVHAFGYCVTFKTMPLDSCDIFPVLCILTDLLANGQLQVILKLSNTLSPNYIHMQNSFQKL